MSGQRPDTESQIYTSGQAPGRGEGHIDPDSARKAFTHAERPRGGVWQDKGVLTNAASASPQPAPHTKGVRAGFTNNHDVRSQNYSGAKQRSGRLTIWGIDPAVYSELERIASEERLSLSQVSKTALGEWLHQSLHDRHEALLYPVLRQLIRDELHAFGNRIIFFLMRIAFAAEQSRILITNVMHKMIIQMGLPIDKFNAMVESSNKMARRNIITHAPEIKKLMEELETAHESDLQASQVQLLQARQTHRSLNSC